MAEAGEEAPAPPVVAPAGPGKAGSCPDYAVLCSFLERYGAGLDLPEITFPELEEALEETKAVSRVLVELHLKLMRKIGKSVTFDRWEKYLVKICQDYNSTWAWEMEKKGYLEMSVECKVGLLKHLCECQFDDNLKFKNAINEEDADLMRIQPIGRDKDGLMYWYQLDQDHNVRMYIEEQDDQDGSTWKCIVRTRNELAETLELLKAQIDPALLKKSEPQDSSSRESPNPEDEELKKGESGEKLEEDTKEGVKEKLDPADDTTSSCPTENGNTCKPGDKEPLKTISEIKTEPPDAEEGKKATKEESDSFKENVKPVKVDLKNEKAEPKDLKELKGTADKIPSAQEPEHSEISVIVKRTEDHVEKSVEDSEKMKNDQQAKIPLKKRELKLTDDFDGPVKTSLCKSKTPTKELLQKEEEKLDDDSTKTSAAPATVSEGKQLVNGELNGDKSHKAKVDHVENSNTTPRESIISTTKEENGVAEKRTSSVIKSLHELKENSKPRIPENLEKSAKDLNKDIIPPSSEETSPKTSSKEDASVSETQKANVDSKGEEKKELLSSVEKEKTAKTKKDCKIDTNDSESVKETEIPKKPAIVATSDIPDDEKLSEAEKTEQCASEDKKSCDSEKQNADGINEEVELKTRDTKKKASATARSKLAASRKRTSAAAKNSTSSKEKFMESNKEDEGKCEPVSSDKAEEKEKEEEEKAKPEEKEKQVRKPPEIEKKTFSLRSKRREKPTAKEINDSSETSESKEPEVKKTDGKDKISEKPSLLSRNKPRLQPLAEEDNSGSESKEMTSERQKDGLKLTIRISNKKRRPELPVESVPADEPEDAEDEDCIGRRLRRSPRISRPSIKVVEVKERKPEKKQSDDEEAKPAPAKQAREEKKAEKEPCQKVKQKPKQKRRARWTNSRSRRKRKSSSEDESEESDSEEESEEQSENEEKQEGVPGEDDEPCKKCGLPNHPELILLCDSCDSGYHTACLRPPLMLIPDGEWFCPPCQHKLLCEKLDEQLQNLDVVLKKKERAERRKERLVYVGISLENIIPTQETDEVPEVQEKEEKKKKKSKPLERRSTRTRKFISYRFDEFDEAIDEAIEDDIRDADGGGGGGGGGHGKDMSNITGHRGKDISTILESERTEGKRPPRVVTRRKKRRRLNDLDSDSNLDEDESEDEFRISEGSQEEFVVSEENVEESDEDQQSNDSDFGTRRPRRHYQRPVRKSTRLRKRVRRYSDDDDDDDDDSDEERRESETDDSSAYSDDYLETRRRRSRRNQKRQVNYREESESDGSQRRARFGRGKEMRRVLKRRFSSSESNASAKSGDSEDEKPRGLKRSLLRKRIRSSNDELSEEEEEKPIRKRLNRIETDDEDEEADAKPVDSSDKPPAEEQPPATSTVPENTKKPCYRLESDEDEDFENVSKDGSPLDYSLVDLPSANGQSPGKTIETLIGKPSEKSQTSKEATAAVSQAPNGTGGGQEAAVPEEDEDELLRVTDLVDYVCNSEQL